MSLNDDLEYLQAENRTEGQRWGWLAGRLDQITRNSDNDFARLNNHEKQLDRHEKALNRRQWQGRLLWVALVAALGGWVDRFVGKGGGG